MFLRTDLRGNAQSKSAMPRLMSSTSAIPLKYKLISTTIGLFLVIIWALAWFSSTVLQCHLEEVLADQQFAYTQSIASNIDLKLAERLQGLSSIAEHMPEELRQDELDSFLPRLKALHTMFPAGVAIIGLDGKTIADYPQTPGRRGGYFGDRDYFRAVVQTKRAFIGKPVIDRALKQPVLPIAVPVFGRQGELRAVMTGITDLTAPNFFGIASDSVIVGKGGFHIVSPDVKLIIASSDTERIMTAPPARGENVMYDRFAGGFEGSGMALNSRGISELFSGARVPSTDWIAISSLPTEIAFGPARAMREYLFIVAAGLTLLAFFLIQWMTRYLLQPLEAAGESMRRMTQGQEALSPLPISRNDEVGQLIGNFNLLVQDRQRVETALAESERRFRMLVEGAPDAIFVQAGGRFVYVNDAAVSLFGANTKKELLGLSVISRIPPDYQEVVSERMRLVNDAMMPAAPLEQKYLRLDGEEVDVEVLAVPFQYENEDGALVFVREIAERKRIEQQLRKNKASLDHAQRIAHIGSWEWDLESGEFFWSEEMFRIMGWEQSKCKPSFSVFLEQVCPDDRNLLQEAVSRAVQEKTACQLDFCVMLPNGEVREIHSEAEIITDGSGRMACLAGTTQDVTEKKRAESMLRKREEELRALVENLPDIITRYDGNFRCIYANPAIEHAIGLRPEKIIGRTMDEFGIPESVAATVNASIGKVIRMGKPDTFEYSLESPSGSRHYQALTVPEFGADGEVQNVLSVARDITIIKGGEAILRDSEQRLHGITANIPGMVFQCRLTAGDAAPVFTYVSEGAAQLLGLTPVEILQNHEAISMRIAQPDRDAYQDSLHYSALTMEVWQWEGRTFPVVGAEKWISCRATPRPAGDGRVIWEGVMLNISDSKRGEEELRQSRQMLRELSEHTERAREEERKRIAREVHDELGQALTALRMDVSLLRLNFGSHSPQLMERIQAMREKVDSTIQMVRHVTTTLRPVALDLGLTASLEWLVEQIGEHTGIECALMHDGCDELALDETQATALFRMVQESLTNVIKHADASRVLITIVVENEHDLCVKIRDNGKGFNPGNARKAGSFGIIGMRERALMLRGTLDIQSVPGSGTLVEICLPLHVR